MKNLKTNKPHQTTAIFVSLILILLTLACETNIDNPSDPANPNFWTLQAIRCATGECPSEVFTSQVLKTGLTTCWDGTGLSRSCVGTGEDGEHQLGLARNFTGPTLFSASDYITTDTTTGLVWKSCTEGSTSAATACDTSSPSTLSWGGADTQCTGLNYAGRSDWRLPTVQELGTLVDYSASANPSIFASATLFPNTLSNVYWSSSIDAGIGGNYFTVSFSFGGSSSDLSGNNHIFRCVSASSGLYNTTPVFTGNDNGTITDTSTNLVWQKCSYGQTDDATCTGTTTTATWEQALTYCNGLSLADKTWRLPNIHELESIVDYTTSSPAIDTAFFPNTSVTTYWTSSTLATTFINAWYIDFSMGRTKSNITKTTPYSVRCVATR